MSTFKAKHLSPEEEAEFRRQFAAKYEIVLLQAHLHSLLDTIPDSLQGIELTRTVLSVLEADARGEAIDAEA